MVGLSYGNADLVQNQGKSKEEEVKEKGKKTGI